MSVDELTVILGLLGLVCEDHAGDDDIRTVASRVAERIRERLRSIDDPS